MDIVWDGVQHPLIFGGQMPLEMHTDCFLFNCQGHCCASMTCRSNILVHRWIRHQFVEWRRALECKPSVNRAGNQSYCHWMAMSWLLLSPPLHTNGKPLGESLFCYSACAWQHGLKFQWESALLLNKGKKHPPMTWNSFCIEDQKHKSSSNVFLLWHLWSSDIHCKSFAFSRLWIYQLKKLLSSRCYGRKLKHKKLSSRH